MAANTLIWIIEGDKIFSDQYRAHIGPHTSVETFSNLNSLRKKISAITRANKAQWPNLVISELDLSDGNFLEFYKNTNQTKNLSNLVIVSTQNSVANIESCFEAGAVDFFCKPLHWTEFSVKINRHLQNSGKKVEFHFCDSQLELLTPKEQKIFKLLNSAPNLGSARDDIINSIWGSKAISKKVFDVHLFHLRKKLWALGIEVIFNPPNVYKLRKRTDSVDYKE